MVSLLLPPLIQHSSNEACTQQAALVFFNLNWRLNSIILIYHYTLYTAFPLITSQPKRLRTYFFQKKKAENSENLTDVFI